MGTNVLIAHAIYVVFMLIGACVIFYGITKSKGVPKIDYLVAGIIPIWSGLAYFSIFLGQGVLEVDGRIVYIARYIDWVVTTPLLLFTLCSVAMFYTKKNATLIIGVIVFDIIMILCGLMGDISQGVIKFIWFGLGIVAFGIVFYFVWVPLRRIAQAQSKQLYKLYMTLAVYNTVLWVGYPAAWYFGASGINVLPGDWDVYLFIGLPILSKVGFSLLALAGLRKLKA